MPQEVYELGRICKELADARGVALLPLAPGELIGNIPVEEFTVVGKDIDLLRERGSPQFAEAALQGENKRFHFAYMGADSPGFFKPEVGVTYTRARTEALFVRDSQRRIIVRTMGPNFGWENILIIDDMRLVDASKALEKAGISTYVGQRRYSFKEINENTFQGIKRFLEQILEQ